MLLTLYLFYSIYLWRVQWVVTGCGINRYHGNGFYDKVDYLLRINMCCNLIYLIKHYNRICFVLSYCLDQFYNKNEISASLSIAIHPAIVCLVE